MPTTKKAFLRTRPSRSRVFVLLLMAGLVHFFGSNALAETLGKQVAALKHTFVSQLEELAEWCDDEGLTREASFTRGWMPTYRPHELVAFLLAEGPPEFTPESDGDAFDSAWQERFAVLRRRQAESLYLISQRAIKDGRASLAVELTYEAARQDPSHVPTRRILGYLQFQDGWYRPYSVQRMRRGQVWHDRFGWILRKHVDRYEQGQRLSNGRWMTAEEDAAMRTGIRHGWKVETEHFLVRTNHSLEAGVSMAKLLEELHDVWQQVFLGYLASDAELSEMLRGRGTLVNREPRHNVVYFRSRDEYNDFLRPSQPQIDITLGIYFDLEQTAFFFAGEEQDSGTILHEATHQLFQEAIPSQRRVGRLANFWVIEGIACYMETLNRHGDYVTLGGEGRGRLPAARHRLLNDGFYVPLDEFTAMGMMSFQHAPNLSQLYSQAAGMATFLMHHDEGLYRDALVRYLRAVYSGVDRPNTLASLTGADFVELDSQYRRYLQSLDTAPTTGAE